MRKVFISRSNTQIQPSSVALAQNAAYLDSPNSSMSRDLSVSVVKVSSDMEMHGMRRAPLAPDNSVIASFAAEEGENE